MGVVSIARLTAALPLGLLVPDFRELALLCGHGESLGLLCSTPGFGEIDFLWSTLGLGELHLLGSALGLGELALLGSAFGLGELPLAFGLGELPLLGSALGLGELGLLVSAHCFGELALLTLSSRDGALRLWCLLCVACSTPEPPPL